MNNEPENMKDILLYRLPLYVLLPLSIIFYWINYSLYESSGRDESIYTDSTVRLGMSGFMPFLLLVLFVGSILLIGAIGALTVNGIKEKRFDKRGTLFVVLGLLCHPWVAGFFLDMIFRR
jgi:hypothetical protein